MTDWNTATSEEFRSNGGKVGGHFEGATLLLLHHVGARTGTKRVTPMMYRAVGDSYAVFASKAGADSNPDWYHNVVAHPDVSAEIGEGMVELRTRIALGDEREAIWSAHKADHTAFAQYETLTSRTIPVIILDPR